MRQSETIGALAEALAKAQAAFPPIVKDREVKVKHRDGGGSHTFRYATLDCIIEATRPHLAANGIAVLQGMEEGQMVTTLIHSSGEWRQSAVPMHELPFKPQEAGALLSYFRRYGLCAALCIASDDDDEHAIAEPQAKRGSLEQKERTAQARAKETPPEVMQAYLKEARRWYQSIPMLDKQALAELTSSQAWMDAMAAFDAVEAQAKPRLLRLVEDRRAHLDAMAGS